ncbi:hypothetical protein ALQ79_200167 [Pseudomonas amygdali pv. lachrymans]|nr:hypothetical protein ALQ79_200167 [Pseudomonas amygdali pv. lachrymans]
MGRGLLIGGIGAWVGRLRARTQFNRHTDPIAKLGGDDGTAERYQLVACRLGCVLIACAIVDVGNPEFRGLCTFIPVVSLWGQRNLEFPQQRPGMTPVTAWTEEAKPPRGNSMHGPRSGTARARFQR